MGISESKMIEQAPSAPTRTESLMLSDFFAPSHQDELSDSPKKTDSPMYTAAVENYEVEFSMDFTCQGLRLDQSSLSVFKNFYYDYKGDGHIKPLIAILIGVCSMQCFNRHIKDPNEVFSFMRSERINAVIQAILKDGGHIIRPGIVQSDSFRWMVLNGSVTISYRIYVRSTRSDGIKTADMVKMLPSILAKNLFLNVKPTKDGPMYTCEPSCKDLKDPPFNPDYKKSPKGSEEVVEEI